MEARAARKGSSTVHSKRGILVVLAPGALDSSVGTTELQNMWAYNFQH